MLLITQQFPLLKNQTTAITLCTSPCGCQTIAIHFDNKKILAQAISDPVRENGRRLINVALENEDFDDLARKRWSLDAGGVGECESFYACRQLLLPRPYESVQSVGYAAEERHYKNIL